MGGSSAISSSLSKGSVKGCVCATGTATPPWAVCAHQGQLHLLTLCVCTGCMCTSGTATPPRAVCVCVCARASGTAIPPQSVCVCTLGTATPPQAVCAHWGQPQFLTLSHATPPSGSSTHNTDRAGAPSLLKRMAFLDFLAYLLLPSHLQDSAGVCDVWS